MLVKAYLQYISHLRARHARKLSFLPPGMGLFPSPPPPNVFEGSVVAVRPSRWKKLFGKRRSTPSLSEAITRSFRELRTVSSFDDVGVIGRVQEVSFGIGFSDSDVRSSSSTDLSRKASVDSFTQTLEREMFSEKGIILQEIEDENKQILRGEYIVRPLHVDAKSDEGGVEMKDAVEISVIAEVHHGISTRLARLNDRSSNYS
jgi:hypothetical protein